MKDVSLLPKKRILYVDTFSELIGGAEISLLLLMDHLDQKKYIPYLLTKGNGGLSQAARAKGIPVLSQNFNWFSRRRPWIYWLDVITIMHFIHKNRIDIIHTNCELSLNQIGSVLSFIKIPLISHIRDYVRDWFSNSRIKTLQNANYIVANSDAISNYCSQAGLQPEKIVTVYNPINLEPLVNINASVKKLARAKFSIPDDTITIGLVGQVNPIKGHDVFIAACLQTAKFVKNAHFLIAGSILGSENLDFFNKFWRVVQESEYRDRFHYLGFQENISELMASINILVVPSYREAFGRVAVEGMAAGCAVIATNIGGLPEIIKHGTNGLLIPPKNPDALTEALLALIFNRELFTQLSDFARIEAKKYSVKNHVNKIQRLYEIVSPS